MSRRSGRFRFACVAAGIIALAPMVAAQQIGRTADAPSTQAPPKDVLGRDTPRGTVLGFMNAARGGRDEVATQYLNTRLRDQSAIELARQLFAVLDKRLPARLGELSDRPEGSMTNPLKPDQDVVATIASGDGTLDVVLERANRSGSSPVWLFSRQTLDAIPDVYADINLVAVDQFMPAFLTKPRLGGVRLFDWLALFLAVPLGYRLLGLLGRPLGPIVISWRRRLGYTLPVNVVPGDADHV